MTAEHWLDFMPARPCPEGCVVRRGGELASVVYNRRGEWLVALIGASIALGVFGMIESNHTTGKPTPEAAGWVHALDSEHGFGWVWLQLQAYMFPATFEECARASKAAGVSHGGWLGIRKRRWQRATTDADRIAVAKAYAAIVARLAGAPPPQDEPKKESP